MATLPRPEVDIVETSDQKKHLVISRGEVGHKKAKTFEIRGATEHERLKNLGGDIINDRTTGEWLP